MIPSVYQENNDASGKMGKQSGSATAAVGRRSSRIKEGDSVEIQIADERDVQDRQGAQSEKNYRAVTINIADACPPISNSIVGKRTPWLTLLRHQRRFVSDCQETRRRRIAPTQLLERGGTVSVQVLNEFAAVASRKLGMKIPRNSRTSCDGASELRGHATRTSPPMSEHGTRRALPDFDLRCADCGRGDARGLHDLVDGRFASWAEARTTDDSKSIHRLTSRGQSTRTFHRVVLPPLFADEIGKYQLSSAAAAPQPP